MQLDQLVPKTDYRGSLVEAFKFPTDGQLFYVMALPGQSRGNHYHQRKTERFIIIAGSAELSSKDRTTGNVMKAELNGGRPMIVTVPPNNTHSITAGEEGVIFLVWVDEQFNNKDPDTFPEEI
jgi:UDP-2-acetamido-2,6-beta-L-arabino-hexul-4-ose reductase